MDQFGIHPLCPAPRGWIEFVREDAHGNRDGDAFGVEIREFVLPIETGARKRRVRQPGDRDVVEDVVAREALRLSVKDARDELIAAPDWVHVVSRELHAVKKTGVRGVIAPWLRGDVRYLSTELDLLRRRRTLEITMRWMRNPI